MWNTYTYTNGHADGYIYTFREAHSHSKAASDAAAKALIPELARRSPARAGRRRVIGDE